jgi:hypothetical protein
MWKGELKSVVNAKETFKKKIRMFTCKVPAYNTRDNQFGHLSLWENWCVFGSFGLSEN